MIEHFWTPPAGVSVLGMAKFEDMIVVACTDGLWVISPKERPMDNYVVHRITNEYRRL